MTKEEAKTLKKGDRVRIVSPVILSGSKELEDSSTIRVGRVLEVDSVSENGWHIYFDARRWHVLDKRLVGKTGLRAGCRFFEKVEVQ